MARPARAHIDLQALRDNYQWARQLNAGCKALAVIKADAYGHGAVKVARALADQADGFAVASIEEALELRESGIQNPILLLEGVFEPAELALASSHELWITVHCQSQLEWLLAAPLQRPLKVWLKMDSGMHRLGFAPQDYRAAYAALAQSPQVSEIVTMTHLARADETDCPFTPQQRAIFEDITQDMPCERSIVNSAGLMAWPPSQGEWVRPGLALYGVSPLSGSRAGTTPLRPVMTLASQLIAVRQVNAGEAIGYGTHCITQGVTRIGVVAMGYADGYPRAAANGTPVAVAGQRTQLLGRVSMDMLTVDLTHLPHAAIGDAVELWGLQIGIEEVAKASQTIPYELLARMTRRVERHYRHQ